ncbi:MAG TPA: ATPase domain-containing protein [Thermoplasmata archaeon]|nr:ATPase domain-containing protein [Thermoplasmata archaeon]
MPPPTRCPHCLAMNDEDRSTCRICGRNLREEEAGHPPTAPVTLQRVMSGEIFTAVAANPSKAKEQQVLDLSALQDPAPVPVEVTEPKDLDRLLPALAERFGKDASATGQRFKRYAPAAGRKPTTPDAKKAAPKHLESAVAALREKRFEDAIEHLLKALSKDDEDVRTWTLLGGTYLRLDRPFKAAVGFLRAAELDPASENAWLGLARCFKAVQDLSGALEVLDWIVQSHPDRAEAWSERGLVLEGLQNPSEAARSYARALEFKQNHKIARERHEALAALAVHEPEAPGPSAPPATPPVAARVELDEFPEFDDLAASGPAPPKESTRPARVKTYVEGLDESIGGGVPWGHVVLLQGAPGTMKSSLGFSILLHNAVHAGLHCLYLSLEERSSSLLKQMGALGLHLQVERGSLVVLDPRTAKGLLSERPDWIDGFQEAIASIQAERGLDLVVIDSLEALEVLAKFKDHRREVYRLFEWLRDLGVTSFLITERPDWVIAGHVIQGRWDEDFLADGVFHLRQHLVTDLEVQRRLRVVKMRGTKHESGYLALVLDEGRFKVTRAMSP